MKPVEISTVIGRSVTIRGELSASEDLYLDGHLQGTLTLPSNCLTVGPNAHVMADLNVRDITVFGRIEGNIRATGRVDLRQSAVILGDILAVRLSIEEKATIQGKIEVALPPVVAPNHGLPGNSGSAMPISPAGGGQALLQDSRSLTPQDAKASNIPSTIQETKV